MNSQRTHAYGRVVKTLDDLGPAKLQPAELDVIRDAADTLIFASTADETLPALAGSGAHRPPVSGGRWTEERAEQLLRDLEACGPVSPVG